METCFTKSKVDLDGAVENERGRLTIDSMLELAVGVVCDDSVIVVRQAEEHRVGDEGRNPQVV